MSVYSVCPVCGSEIVQGNDLVQRTCNICGKEFISNYYCKNGHYICNTCSSKPLYKAAESVCKNTKSQNPVEIAEQIMNLPEFTLVGCKHYIVTLTAILAAYVNAGGRLADFEKTNKEIGIRTVICPTAMCRLGGFCGIPITLGIAMRSSMPPEFDEKASTDLANKLTGFCMSKVGNPNNTGNHNCCKRNTYLTIIAAVKFISSNLWIEMKLPDMIVCKYHKGNPRCNKEECSFFHGVKTK